MTILSQPQFVKGLITMQKFHQKVISSYIHFSQKEVVSWSYYCTIGCYVNMNVSEEWGLRLSPYKSSSPEVRWYRNYWRKTQGNFFNEIHWLVVSIFKCHYPDSKVHGANMGPIWGRQDPDGLHVGPMNFAIWVYLGFWNMLLHIRVYSQNIMVFQWYSINLDDQT